MCLISVEKAERLKVRFFLNAYRLWRGELNLTGSYEQNIGKGTLYRVTENFLRINSLSSNTTACRMAGTGLSNLVRIKADSHIACRSHAVLLPCRAAKGLECVFPIWFTQRGRVWFTLAMPCPCHAPTMTFFSRPQHSTARPSLDRRAVALRKTAWSENGMGMAWQVWIRHGPTV